MIGLVAPAALAALAALIIPILVHLVRRSERQRTSFAAMRWLSERTRPRKQLYLHERLLLALRLLLLALLALLLALPVWRGRGGADVLWNVVDTSLAADAARAAVSDPSAEWHWLAPGFPLLDTPPPSTTSPQPVDFSSLVRELDTRLPRKAKLTLIVPQQINGLDAERLRLGRDVDWHVLKGSAPIAVPAAPKPSLHVAVRNDAQGEAEISVVRALAKSWEADGAANVLDVAPIGTAIAPGTALLFWLAPIPDPAFDAYVSHGGTALVPRSALQGEPALVDDESGESLLHVAAIGQGHAFALATALTPSATPALLDASLPKRLRRLLVRNLAAKPGSAPADAVKPLRSESPSPGPAASLEAWLALILALLFVAERFLATREQGVVA